LIETAIDEAIELYFIAGKNRPGEKSAIQGIKSSKGKCDRCTNQGGRLPDVSIVNDPSISAKGRKAKLIDESGVNV
jgi:hypothetical protein